MAVNSPAGQKFIVEILKPSHYDDHGYVVQWLRSSMPSNSLSALYGITLDARQRRILGDDVEIEIHARDETNLRLPIKRIIRNFKRNGNRGIVSGRGAENQFPRAMDITRQFRAAGSVRSSSADSTSADASRCFRDPPDDLQEAIDLGITLFAGEAEGRIDGALLRRPSKHELNRFTTIWPDLPRSGWRSARPF